MLVLLAVMGARVAHLTIVERSELWAKAQSQYLNTIHMAAPRGQIRDREGTIFADTVGMPSIYASPRYHPVAAEHRDALAKALGMPPVAEVGAGVTRRAVLAGGAGTGLLIAVGGFMPQVAFAAAPGPEGAATGPPAPNQFVRVGTDNLVTIVCKHHEMGEGNTTGLATLVADELDADWSLVRTEYAPADAKRYANLAFGMQGTGGSSAIANSYLQYRTAGATARAMLVAAAA
ncbi:MAG: hypothetical protein ABUL50_11705, partial [Rhizobacter sp.]